MWFGAWPLALEGSDPGAIRRSLQWLRDGGAVVIFPEGGRSTETGSLERFKAGAVRLALEAEVPILPVTIKGGNRIWPRGWRFPRLGKVTVTYHPLYHAEQCPNEETRACARRESERLAKVIESALEPRSAQISLGASPRSIRKSIEPVKRATALSPTSRARLLLRDPACQLFVPACSSANAF